jgi:hypothetical protein
MMLAETYTSMCGPLETKISTSGKEVFIRIDQKDGSTTIYHLPLFKDEVESMVSHFVERVCKAYGVDIIPKVVINSRCRTRSVYIPQKMEIRLCPSADLHTVLHEIAHHLQYIDSGMKRGCEKDAENFAKSHESEWVDLWKIPSLYMNLLCKAYYLKNSSAEKEAVLTLVNQLGDNESDLKALTYLKSDR